jgi:ankyrin repeat protein
VAPLLHSFPEGLPNVYYSAPKRWTVLHAAALLDPPAHHLGQILRLVDIAFCSQPDESGNTPLSLICQSGNDLDAIRLLALAQPQDFFSMNANENGMSPCDVLIWRVHEDHAIDGLNEAGIAQIIVDAAEAWPDGVLIVNYSGHTLLQRAIPFSLNKFTLVRRILEIHPGLMEMTDLQGATAIHVAARACDKYAGERLNLLLECGGSRALCVQDSNGRTPLHEACHCGADRDVIATLVANHASALDVRDTVGMTPLETFRQHTQSFLANINYTSPYLANNGYTYDNLADIAVTLLTRAPVRCSDSPSLHELLRNQECTSQMAYLLTYALRDQTHLEDSNGSLPLHIVASIDSNNDFMYRKVVESLLEMYPAACQISNSERTLPLQLMDRSGKSWRNGMRMVLLQHPAAVLDLGLNHGAMCALMEKVGSEEKPDALFRLLVDAPAFVAGVQYRM